MKNLKKLTVLFAAALALYLFASCSNSAGGGGSNPAPSAPTPPAQYTVTFNANNGTSATETQTFTAGTAQALTSISDLGFSKSGFYFAGWGTTADATESAYADGAEYTASADITFYALWSAMPVYSVNISSEHGTVTPSPATGIAGTEITLSNTPATGWQFDSYTVTDGSTNIAVVNNKFTMPGQDVTVTANFTAIDYDVEIGSITNGSVVAKIGTSNVNTANYGQTITLTTTAESDNYRLNTLSVTANDGTSVTLSGTGNTRTFVMPAKSVTVNATFESKHTITLPTSIEGGTIIVDKTAAFAGETVLLTISPVFAYKLETLTITNSDGASEVLNENDNGRIFTMPAKNVTVTATFAEIPAASGEYTRIGTKTINGVEYDIVTFGLWPQTKKVDSVSIDTTQQKPGKGNYYYKGSDGQWYNKAWNEYYKVEPIKWRVLTTDYNGTGKKLLLSESILYGVSYCAAKKNELQRMVNSISSIKDYVSVNSYEFSQVRAFLNGLTWLDGSGQKYTYSNDSFLQAAFTDSERNKIVRTSVDNSRRSANPDDGTELYDTSSNDDWIITRQTNDKIFLLSVQEVTKTEYGFAAYNDDDPARGQDYTDYAKNCVDYPEFPKSYLLRSPFYTRQAGITLNRSMTIYLNAVAPHGSIMVNKVSAKTGVVPALCVE